MNLRSAVLALIALMVIGCGPGNGGRPACSNEMSIDCPVLAPTYSAEVAPIIQSRCLQCHAPGGVQAVVPFQTYDQVHGRRASIELWLGQCLMPPADQPQPTDQERRTVLDWITCGAPNN